MENKEVLKEILIGKEVVESVQENLQLLSTIIPEICDMFGFEHKHPHHHLNVWEHTLFALSFSPNNFDIRLALLLHDVGKPYCLKRDGKYHYHAVEGVKIAEKVLKPIAASGAEHVCEQAN